MVNDQKFNTVYLWDTTFLPQLGKLKPFKCVHSFLHMWFIPYTTWKLYSFVIWLLPVTEMSKDEDGRLIPVFIFASLPSNIMYLPVIRITLFPFLCIHNPVLWNLTRFQSIAVLHRWDFHWLYGLEYEHQSHLLLLHKNGAGLYYCVSNFKLY